MGVSSPYSKRCQLVYDRLLEALGTEIEVLFHRSAAEIREVHADTGDAVDALHRGRVRLDPGGGGKFGSFSFITTERHREDGKAVLSDPLRIER
jgi:PHP family Zn ribbon phosphoesterase